MVWFFRVRASSLFSFKLRWSVILSIYTSFTFRIISSCFSYHLKLEIVSNRIKNRQISLNVWDEQSLYMGYNLLLLWVWCTIILSLRNICSTLILQQPLLSELMGKSFSLRFQKLDSEVGGWFWCPYLGVGSWRTNTVSDFYWYMYTLCFGSATALRADASRWFLD